MPRTNPTTLRERLEAIIFKYFDMRDIFYASERHTHARYVADALESICRDYALEVIGEDETLPPLGKVSSAQLGFAQSLLDDRNKVRTEQRDRITNGSVASETPSPASLDNASSEHNEEAEK